MNYNYLKIPVGMIYCGLGSYGIHKMLLSRNLVPEGINATLRIDYYGGELPYKRNNIDKKGIRRAHCQAKVRSWALRA